MSSSMDKSVDRSMDRSVDKSIDIDEAPIIKLVNHIISQSIKARASGAEKAMWPRAGSASSPPTMVIVFSVPFNR